MPANVRTGRPNGSPAVGRAAAAPEHRSSLIKARLPGFMPTGQRQALQLCRLCRHLLWPRLSGEAARFSAQLQAPRRLLGASLLTARHPLSGWPASHGPVQARGRAGWRGWNPGIGGQPLSCGSPHAWEAQCSGKTRQRVALSPGHSRSWGGTRSDNTHPHRC